VSVNRAPGWNVGCDFAQKHFLLAKCSQWWQNSTDQAPSTKSALLRDILRCYVSV
jgi:hypothetical protein